MLRVAAKQTTEDEEIRALGQRFVENHIKRFHKKAKAGKVSPGAKDFPSANRKDNVSKNSNGDSLK